ncbi:MAG TPA: hypothetical protein VFJ50_03300 [Gemmatimonadales bacterium]|nr:hypothetical protein [Gemmatimonadales bacterium]
MGPDPQIEPVHEDRATVRGEEAERMITAGAVFTVVLAVTTLVVAAGATYWLWA